MYKILTEHSKSIDELYIFTDILQDYLKDLEKRVSELEKNAECDEYNKR